MPALELPAPPRAAVATDLAPRVESPPKAELAPSGMDVAPPEVEASPSPAPSAPIAAPEPTSIPLPPPTPVTTGTGSEGEADETAVAAASGEIFELAGVDERPRLLQRTEPRLPSSVRRSRSAERVELIVVIDREGYVASARVRFASHEALAAPCLEAVQSWRFRPAMRDGRPVAVRLALPLVIPPT
jgi:protein TonB